ncbi:MAG: hypothetical protein IJI14_08095 [Anaerolineaceae bacterium]|nr:hypothetical protein [Anaerolineaceae bacterium]
MKGNFTVALDYTCYQEKKQSEIIAFEICSNDRDPEFLLPGEVQKYCLERFSPWTEISWSYVGCVSYPNGEVMYVDSGETGYGDDIKTTTRKLCLQFDCNEIAF